MFWFKWKEIISLLQKLISLEKIIVFEEYIFFWMKLRLKFDNTTWHYKTKNTAKNMKKDSVRKYVHMRRKIPSRARSCIHFGWPFPSPHQLPTHLIDGSFLNQKTYKDIRILYSLKSKRSKNKFLYEKRNGSVEWINIQESSI